MVTIVESYEQINENAPSVDANGILVNFFAPVKTEEVELQLAA